MLDRGYRFMNDVVPGVLQHLREADIISLAGLAGASLGQEYCRRGYVSTTRRKGTSLSGVLTLPERSLANELTRTVVEQTGEEEKQPGSTESANERFDVTVEILSRTNCLVECACGKQAILICTHAAALLYQWVARPQLFLSHSSINEATDLVISAAAPPSSVPKHRYTRSESLLQTRKPSASVLYAPLSSRRQEVNTIGETLTQLGLSELRAIAREYGIAVVGLGKQQLIETMIETLSKPETVRRIVGTLEKPQRQLLAAFALAGGSMSDEDLRGLFERFSLGNSGTLQEMLVALQAKLLIVRSTFHSLQPRFNANLSPLDLNWYIPHEVREALHATLPITPFNVEVPYGKGASPSLPALRLAEPYKLLTDLLLIARVLDGFPVEASEKRTQRSTSFVSGNKLSTDGSLALPPPDDQPAPAISEALVAKLQHTPGFLRFALRLLRQAELLYKDTREQESLRAHPDVAQRLLGPARGDVLHDLFTRWLKQASYAELYELVENGIRVRCRATPMNQPDLRKGELEQENSEARQEVVALLAQVPPGEWINFSAFARFLYRLQPTFLRHRQHLFPSPHWWIEREEGHPLHPAQLADWLRAEGRYLAHLIQGPLHWWGLCDLALAQGGQLLAFRLTPLADFLFHGRIQDEQEGPSSPVAALTVSHDGCLLLAGTPDNWPLIACIEAFAESKGIQNGHLLYCLTAHSLSAALSQGRDAQDLLTLLRNFSRPEEGHTLQQLLATIERRITNYGRVRLYTDVAMLQTADASVMQQLTAITSLDQQVVCPVQPTFLLLKKQGAERLLEELKRRGQTPLLHGEE